MLRTQIYFPKSLHEDLKTEAAAMGISLSEYIRMVLEEKLYLKKPTRNSLVKKEKAKPSVIAESAISFGIKDLARNFDKYFEASLK